MALPFSGRPLLGLLALRGPAQREVPSWFELDNVNVTVVPLPVALLLLGSGLVGMAVRRIRKG